MAGSGQYFQQIMQRLHFSSKIIGRMERQEAVLFIRILPKEAGIGGISAAPLIVIVPVSSFFGITPPNPAIFRMTLLLPEHFPLF
jgi:hypothetical protein